MNFVTDVVMLIFQVLFALVLSIKDLIMPKKPKSVKGEIVLVTGGAHGIGKDVAHLYASEGATVVIWDIDKQGGGETVKEIADLGYPKAYFFACDISNRDEVLIVAKQVQRQIGNVTILINNAGIVFVRPFLEHTKEQTEKVVNINLMGHFWTLEAFLPIMKQRNYGHIVAISSCGGLLGCSNLVTYCSTKFAVRGLMEALYYEFQEDENNKVKFTTILPYYVSTGLWKKLEHKCDLVMSTLNSEEVAKHIMDAQRCDLKEISIPRYTCNMTYLCRLLPVKIQILINNFFVGRLESEL